MHDAEFIYEYGVGVHNISLHYYPGVVEVQIVDGNNKTSFTVNMDTWRAMNKAVEAQHAGACRFKPEVVQMAPGKVNYQWPSYETVFPNGTTIKVYSDSIHDTTNSLKSDNA